MTPAVGLPMREFKDSEPSRPVAHMK
jgi:hypothetical protein